MRFFVGIKTQLAVELLAFCFAVGAVAIDIKRTVVSHQPVVSHAPGVLPVAAVHTKRTGIKLGIKLGLLRRITGKGLNHATRGISIHLRQRATQDFDVVGGRQADGGALPLTIGCGCRNAINQQANTPDAKGRAGAKAPNRYL